MAQEAAVHRWDAESASGRAFSIDAVVAADGVDEFLTWFAGDRYEGAEAPGGTIGLACTDVDASWVVTRVAQDDVAFSPGTKPPRTIVPGTIAPGAADAGPTGPGDGESAEADVVVRAPASDLLLWLWRRDGGPVTVEGDAAVAARFQAGTDLE
jgi:hypothetical protein